MGRVIESDAPDPPNNSLTSGIVTATCYSFDALGNLKRAAPGAQTRTYHYDMLSRLTSASTLESGTTTYSHFRLNQDRSSARQES